MRGAVNVRTVGNGCTGYTLQVRHKANTQKLHRALRFYTAAFEQSNFIQPKN